jgi:ABC-type transport system substrate-binding protein
MRPFRSASLAVASAILIATAPAAARPRYGGVLRVQMQGTLRALDPAAEPATALERAARRHVLPLIFEQLVETNPDGGLRPLLAASWEGDASGVRWQVRLRPGVMLHDGSLLTPEQVASSLGASRPDWKVAVDGGAIVITPSEPQRDLPWELAELRNAVGVRRASGEIIGTGPFRVERLESRRLILRAHEEHHAGRPFLDGVQIEMGRTPASQLSDLELDRADLVSVGPSDAGRVIQRQLRVASSRPLELFALVFEAHRAAAASEPLRRTVAAAIDREAIRRVLLQGRAEPAEALLPAWLSGYPAFTVASSPPTPDGFGATSPRSPDGFGGTRGAVLSRAAVAALPAAERSLAIRVEAADTLARAMAERVAVDVREAGFSAVVQAPAGLGPRPDLRLIRLPLEASAPDRALALLVEGLAPRTVALLTRERPPVPGSPLETVARVERALLQNGVVVPLVHVPELSGLGARVDSWSSDVVLPTGAWDLANVWLGPDRASR